MSSMQDELSEGEELIYASDEPDIGSLSNAYNTTLADLDKYFDTCLRSFNERRNIWDGKTQDLRKSGSTAFPWQGASDQEVNVVGERINTYISIFDQALQRSHIKAFPTSMASMARAGVVSSFLKWMKSSYIPDFKNQMEQGANYLLEKGLMITYVGYKRESRTYLQPMTLDEIAQTAPDLIEIILDETNDDIVINVLQQAFPKLSDKRAKKCVKELRTTGETQIPAPRQSVDCPIAYACAPDGEVIFPSYVSDPQRSPWVFWRCFLTAQELEKKSGKRRMGRGMG